jgi:hypothetical protein
MKNIALALLKAQSEMSNPKKGSSNPFFKSKYADLNAVREAVIPILNENGIVVLQPIIHLDGKNFVKTVLLHESGEFLESLTEIIYNKVNDAQAQGSGISYARRYSLQSFVCVGADDDDGNKAVAPTKLPITPYSPTESQKAEFDSLLKSEKITAEQRIKMQEAFKTSPNDSKTVAILNKIKDVIAGKFD